MSACKDCGYELTPADDEILVCLRCEGQEYERMYRNASAELAQLRAALSEAQTALGERDRLLAAARQFIDFGDKLGIIWITIPGREYWHKKWGPGRIFPSALDCYRALNPADTAEPVMEDVKL